MKYSKTIISSFLFLAAAGFPPTVWAAPTLPSNSEQNQASGVPAAQLAAGEQQAAQLVQSKNELPSSGAISLQDVQLPELFKSGSPDGSTNVWTQGSNTLVFRDARTGQLIKKVTFGPEVTGFGEAQFTSDSQHVFVLSNTQNGWQLSVFDNQGNEVGKKLDSTLWTIEGHILWTSSNMIALTNGSSTSRFYFSNYLGPVKVLAVTPAKAVFLKKEKSGNLVTESIIEIADNMNGAPKITAVNSFAYNPSRVDRTYVAHIINKDQVVLVVTDGVGRSKIVIYDCGSKIFDSEKRFGFAMRVLKTEYIKGALMVTFQPMDAAGNVIGGTVTKRLY